MASKVNYSLERLEFDEGDRAHITEQLLQIKDKYAISGKNVIEFGCGFGHNLELFREDNKVSGLEGLQEAVDKAKENGLDVAYCDLNGPTGVASESADLILCIDVLEHLVEPKTALGEIHRILKPNGFAVLNVPNHFDLAGRIKILMGRSLDTHSYFPDHDEWDNPHIRFFTHDGFARLVEKSGLRVIEDRSPLITSFPLQNRFAPNRLKNLRLNVAKRFPALFVAGHFLVTQKSK